MMRGLRLDRVAVLVTLTAVFVGGCGGADSLSENFGDAVRADLAAQILNPRAGEDMTPPAELDGTAATIAIESYRNSFDVKEQEATPAVIEIK